jgi:hypothetical protein
LLKIRVPDLGDWGYELRAEGHPLGIEFGRNCYIVEVLASSSFQFLSDVNALDQKLKSLPCGQIDKVNPAK